MRNCKIFCAGVVAGVVVFVACVASGLEVEQSSYLQLNNFNEAVSSGCWMVRRSLALGGNDAANIPSKFLDEYIIDAETGFGWSVPMCCRPSEGDLYAMDESDYTVMLFLWRGRPFGVLALGKGCMPKICVMRSFSIGCPAKNASGALHIERPCMDDCDRTNSKMNGKPGDETARTTLGNIE